MTSALCFPRKAFASLTGESDIFVFFCIKKWSGRAMRNEKCYWDGRIPNILNVISKLNKEIT